MAHALTGAYNLSIKLYLIEVSGQGLVTMLCAEH